MHWKTTAAVQDRDRGLGLQRDLTLAVGIGATALLGVFTIVAATTIPGHSAGTALAATTSSDQGSSSTDDFPGVQFQRPADGSFAAGGTAAPGPVAVSGGSR